MSVLISDIRLFGCAEMPETDGATVGGAIDFTKRVAFAAVTTPTLYDLVSSSASDTATKIIYSGRDNDGTIFTETLTANGTTKVNGTLTLERLLYALTSGATNAFGLTAPGGTAALGDIALIAHTLTISGHTMQAGSANASGAPSVNVPPVAHLQGGDGALVAVNMILRTTGGTGANQIRRILATNPSALGADYVAIDRNWDTIPDATTTYEVGAGFHFELAASNGGVALGGTATQALGITRAFATATADVGGGAQRFFYEKFFVNNNNQAFALTGAQFEILSNNPSLPGGAALDMAVCTALNDTNTTTNRQTAPAVGAGSFITQPAFISAPGTGSLPASAGAGSAIGALGLWLRYTLAPGTAPYEGSPGSTVRAVGATN